MPPTRSKSEYRGHSCHQCHKQKVKCSRERPCRNCALANRTCTYAIHDRKVTVSESYIRKLENGLSNPFTTCKSPASCFTTEKECTHASTSRARTHSGHDLNATVENSTAGLFVSKLKQFQASRSVERTFGAGISSQSSPSADSTFLSTPQPKYEYFALEFDTLQTKCTFKLPPYPYTIYLLDQFAIYLGHDWHWFRLRHFRRRLDNTYSLANSVESKDRIWLCQLLVVLALAESVNDAGRRPEITLNLNVEISEDTCYSVPALANVPPPGNEFFEQALKLLHVPHEDASLEHIEALNLIVLYSFQLNRQRTAYMHAGTSARLCNMLQLHKAVASYDCSPCEREHRKRLWWSTYCLDRMTSSQGGYLPILQVEQADLEYPSQQQLLGEDAEQFSDPEYLTARIQLTLFEAENTKSVCDLVGNGTKNIESVIQPMLRRLEVWKDGLPLHMAMDMKNGLPQPANPLSSTRALANLHLRFNQCLILLLRPLLLEQIASISVKTLSHEIDDEVKSMNSICLQSARHTLRILIDIHACGLLVRLGFMENMHLFTSLMIVRLVIAMNIRCPGSFCHESEDAGNYEAGKRILHHMMQSGSLAAKGHCSMLSEVEDLADVIATNGGTEVHSIAEDWDVDEWMARLFESRDVQKILEWQ